MSFVILKVIQAIMAKKYKWIMDSFEIETIILKQCAAIVRWSRVYIGLEIITFKFWVELRAYFSVMFFPYFNWRLFSSLVLILH